MTKLDRRSFLLATSAAALSGSAQAFAIPRASGPAAEARAAYDAIFERVLIASPETATQLGLDTGARASLKSRLSDPTPAGRLG
jgi:uncharacterized protein (DUF885 family)